jgi:hypothetical protein
MAGLRTHASGEHGEGLVIYVILDDQRRVTVVNDNVVPAASRSRTASETPTRLIAVERHSRPDH